MKYFKTDTREVITITNSEPSYIPATYHKAIIKDAINPVYTKYLLKNKKLYMATVDSTEKLLVLEPHDMLGCTLIVA